MIRRVLRNGLEVVGLPRPDAALAAVRLHVPVGSCDESAGEWGMAHLLEHLVVRCSMGGGRVGDGAVVSAATGREHTGYQVVVRPAQVDAAVRTLGAAFDRLALSPRTLSNELAAIRQEMDERVNDDRWRLQEALFADMWHGTRYEHPVLGALPVLDALTPSIVQRWHAAHYLANNAVLIVASGDVTHDVLRLAEIAERWPDNRALGKRRRTADLPAWAISAADVSGPTRRLFGFAVTEAANGGPAGRASMALASEAARATGVDIQHLVLRERVCTWVLLRGPDTHTAAQLVFTTLSATRERLLDRDGDAWLTSTALIPQLRSHDEVDALPRLWLERSESADWSWQRDLRSVGAGEVAGHIANWLNWISAARPAKVPG